MPSDDNFATFQVPPNILHFHHSLREMQLFFTKVAAVGGRTGFLPTVVHVLASPATTLDVLD